MLTMKYHLPLCLLVVCSLSAAEDLKVVDVDTYRNWQCEPDEIGKAKIQWPKELQYLGEEVRNQANVFQPTPTLDPGDPLRNLARSVGRLEVVLQNKFGKRIGSTCTASAISEDHILTNAHCNFFDYADPKIKAEEWKAIRMLVRFGYYAEGDEGEVFEVDPTPFEFDLQRDYAIHSVRGDFASKWGFLPVGDITSRRPVVGEELAIIQHPAGQPQKVSTCHLTLGFNDVELAHDCVSLGGSSGSPMFRKTDSGWELFSLHFAASRTEPTLKFAKRLDRIAEVGHHFARLLPSDTEQTIVMTGNTLGDQRWLLSESMPSQWMEDNWKAGYRITDWTGLDRVRSPLSGATEEHFIVMSLGTNITHQTYFFEKDSKAFPEAWLEEREKEGYRISSCGYAQDSWIVVVTNYGGPQATEIVYGPTPEFDEDYIKTQTDQGYQISTVCRGKRDNGSPSWVLTFSKDKRYERQSYQRSQEFPFQFVRKYWDDGYRISALANDGNWMVVMSYSEALSKKPQSYFYRTYIPTGGMFSGFKNNLQITGVAGK